jgi:hypothetical protein
MDFWVRTPEMIEWIKKERDYLLGFDDLAALKLSVSEQYQRNKYKGEIESAKMLEDMRRKMVFVERPVKSVKKRYDKLKLIQTTGD